MNLVGDPRVLAQQILQQMPNIDPTPILGKMDIPLLPVDIAMRDINGMSAGPMGGGAQGAMTQQQPGGKPDIGQLLAGAQMGVAQPMQIPFAPPPGGTPSGGPQGKVMTSAPMPQRPQMLSLGQLLAGMQR